MSPNNITNPSINFLDAHKDCWIIKAGTVLSSGHYPDLSGPHIPVSYLDVPPQRPPQSRPDRSPHHRGTSHRDNSHWSPVILGSDSVSSSTWIWSVANQSRIPTTIKRLTKFSFIKMSTLQLEGEQQGRKEVRVPQPVCLFLIIWICIEFGLGDKELWKKKITGQDLFFISHNQFRPCQY